ncbi:DUF3899 domain-containing protein [Mycoplasma tauri]|uniref:DUF3899 domain-containing protein n=1 Tax=Mycoplasma tauri TaxID=547987 RepID=UPI001CC00DC4|nr:DUF3899 domain-containing protein [Mycoplasma tauri]MBZ4218382.1 DUF3899 domain-containing protein [Mycoplasma tauri]
MHFVAILIILSIMFLFFYLFKWKNNKTNSSIRIAQDVTFIISLTILTYVGMMYLLTSKLFFSSIKKNNVKRENEIIEKIYEVKSKPSSPERNMRLKILKEQLEEEKKKNKFDSHIYKNNFVLWLLSAISIIFLISAIILTAVN